jgi:ABC-2 type transport system ATP-binding protein
MIAIQNLTMNYGNHTVLKNINIEFDKGKVYGIVGKNGAGKTSLFRCISGLEKYEGTITSSHKQLKNHLGLLLTEPFFFEKITGKEYIQLLCNARQIAINDIESGNIFDLPLNQYSTTFSDLKEIAKAEIENMKQMLTNLQAIDTITKSKNKLNSDIFV